MEVGAGITSFIRFFTKTIIYRFAHGLRELRPIQSSSKKDSKKYRTKICLKYANLGICAHGRDCIFLHPYPDNPKLFLAPLFAKGSETPQGFLTAEEKSQ